MDLELPDRLHATRDLLMRSLATHPLERAPAMPADLAADLESRFAARSVVAAAASSSISWIEKVRSFLAAPGFGAVAATVVVIGIALPLLTQPETFRGDNPVALPADSVRIVLVGENPGISADLRASGNFEAASISAETTAAAAMAIAGPKVVVDFAAGTITAIDRERATVHQVAIPASDVADAVADAISRL